MTATITKESFGATTDGQPVSLYTLTQTNGVRARITDYGGIVVSLDVPDRDGNLGDAVLGYNTVDAYIQDSPYFGALVGRFANRIAHGTFTLDETTYTLATNDDPGGIPCALHGGLKAFDKVVWDTTPVEKDGNVGLTFHYLSKDGEEGYPGNLDVTVTCGLTPDSELTFDYVATTDKATHLNLTHHGYFNLKGEGNGDILDHVLTIAADCFTPEHEGTIPTGEVASVLGTAFDFTTPHVIGERINEDNDQLKLGGGYDHNWVLNNQSGELALAATVKEPGSGRVMEVLTTEPGVQLYCGNFLDGKNIGKSGKPYEYRSGLCLETQHYPDSPNHPEFPTTVLRPGETYRSRTVYRFSTDSPQ